MTAEERSAGLAAAARVRRDGLLALADRELASADAEIVAAPAPGSVMVELENAAGAFCFTEVVVTTASVRLDGAPGWGCVLGFDREAALAAALLDAHPSGELEELLRVALQVERQAEAREAQALAGTRV